MKIADRMGSIQPFHVMALLARARELEASGRSIIHMEIGEPDFVTPQPVIDAGIKALSEGQTHYTPATGLPLLRERIAAFYLDRYGVKVAPGRIIVTPGASSGLQLALAVLVNPMRPPAINPLLNRWTAAGRRRLAPCCWLRPRIRREPCCNWTPSGSCLPAARHMAAA